MGEEVEPPFTSEEELCERLQDAGQALKEIKEGRARGFRVPLIGRALVENLFYYIGYLFALKPPIVSIIVFSCVILFLSATSTGFWKVKVETDEEKLWVESDGRLHGEQSYTDLHLPEDTLPTSELFIQSVMGGDFSMSLMDHLQLLMRIKKIEVHRTDKTYTMDDLCLKNTFPSTHIPLLDRLLSSLNPCLIVTPLDCFWEGSFLHQPTEVVNITECGEYTWAANTTWSNVNVSQVLECARRVYSNDQWNLLLLHSVENGLEQSGTKGYSDRPCIRPSYQGDLCPSKMAANASEVLRGGCSGFASNAMKWPEQILAAGSSWRSGQVGGDPEALQTIIQLFGPETLREYDNSSLNVDDYKGILTEWKMKFTQVSGSLLKRVCVVCQSPSLM
jgi:hypothetical protein